MTHIIDTDNNRLVNQRAFDRVLIIMFENEYRGYVMENDYMRGLAAQGIELCNSFGVMHPSQTNYIASIAGELCGVSDDKQPSPLPQQTIVDLIEASAQNLRWNAYMDSYIAEDTPWCVHNFTPKDHFPYVIKHSPFSSFKNILTINNAGTILIMKRGSGATCLTASYLNTPGSPRTCGTMVTTWRVV